VKYQVLIRRGGKTECLRISTLGVCSSVCSLVAIVLLLVPTARVSAFTRLFYANHASTSAQSFAAHADKIDIIAPQSYSFDINGAVSGAMPETLLKTAREKGIKIMPLITNGTFNNRIATRIVRNQRVQDYLILQMILIAKREGFMGWQLDMENMNMSHRERYSFFVEKVARALHAQGLQLSVAVVSQVSANPADHPPHSWEEWAGVYDYARLGRAADFISIMTYDDGSGAGPVAPLPWVRQVLAHARTQIPVEKISLGIPAYHWEWTVRGRFKISSGGYRYVSNILASSSNPRGYDEKLGAQWVRYNTKRGDEHIVWYEDARSMGEKIKLAKDNNLSGFSLWVIGLEDPALWDTL